MTDREKLTGLVSDILEYLPWGQISSSTAREVADHLIANGMTFATDNNVGCNWIPVTERLPDVASNHKHGRSRYTKSIRVLCVCVQNDGKTMVKEGYCENWNDYPEAVWKIPGTIDSVTHWMPLPEPPKEVE